MSIATPPSFAQFISRYLPGKVQKISVNATFSCPNRDGTKGHGGCSYCNNHSFTPGYAMTAIPVAQQIARGKEFFSRKYPSMRYLAYFQSYTATHGQSTDSLLDMYQQAVSTEGVDGIIIGTRPDCMPQNLLDRLAEMRKNTFVMVEYGAESSWDDTLAAVNRCHTWADTVNAVKRTAEAGIPVGLHLIMGLPGESRQQMLTTIDRVNELPVEIIKCHQMQLIRGTRLADEVARGIRTIPQWSAEEYIDLCCDIIRRLRPGIAVERFVSQSPDALLITPRWGLKNYQFMNLLANRLRITD